MTVSLFSRVVDDHFYGEHKRLQELRDRSSFYEEFDVGFVMLVPENNNQFRLIAGAIDNDFNVGMFKCISKLLRCRQGSIYIQFTANYERLFKASKRYGGIQVVDGIVLFP